MKEVSTYYVSILVLWDFFKGDFGKEVLIPFAKVLILSKYNRCKGYHVMQVSILEMKVSILVVCFLKICEFSTHFTCKCLATLG